MPEISHLQLSDYLLQPEGLTATAVYLIHGEPMLVEQCAEPLIEKLLNGALREISCEVMEGAAENILDAIERMNTYALSAGLKIVWFKEARLFDSGGNQQRLVDQIREALESDHLERAAKGFLTLCARLGVDTHSARQGPPAGLELLQSAVGEDGIVRLSTYCHECGWSAAASDDYLQALELAIQKGFPQQHYLVITTAAKVPKNRKFYKIIQARGLIIDCNIPQGERRADKLAQEAVLRRILADCLDKSGKRMGPALFATLSQLTGFDPPTFRDNVEKLIDYAGKRNEITAADVEAVVRRTKSDPLFELTNAVAERNLINALFYLHTLLNSGWHALQILAALANQIRKLIVAKDFATSVPGRSWRSGMAYPQFQNEVLPAVQAYDAQVDEQMHRWTENASATESKGSPGAKKDGFDLALASNPGNAYPLYQTLLKSENFQLSELVQAMIDLNQTDGLLKSTGQDPAVLMKKLLMAICGKGRKS
ncbi:MAG: hypothetical protein C4519_08350 [Desulfobacteraceae bacterium]|nr:MAG: hypothetical protein C4519_08350 [Desulfobacteraceae bacterium]